MTKSAIVALSLFALFAITPAQAQMVEGTVTKIDESAGKITLKHGPIKKLEMDEGMTMVFRAQDPTMLKRVKVGDKVKFEADKIDGQITVTKIEKAK
jgi:Cu(I)/Ag(I) efflux system protein CusF